MARRLPHGSRLLVLLASLVLVLVAGCGSSGTTLTGAGPDPATIAPADAAVFFQATVRPSGAEKAGVLAAARKVLRVQDPGAALHTLLDRIDGSGRGSYSRDIEPWLGRRIGGFLLFDSADPRHPNFAVAAAIADRGAFDAALARLRKSGDEQPAGSYRGIAYDRDTTDATTYYAGVGDFFLGGTLAGLRAAIDAHAGASLAGTARYKDAAGRVPGDALASVYADPAAILPAVAARGRISPAARRTLAAFAAAGPIVASLTASADEIALDASGGFPAGATPSGSSAQATVGQLPGDAWLALATPPLGPLVKAALQATGMHGAAAAQVRRRTGLDLDKDLLDPLGGLALFVRGESPLDIGGGVLLQMTSAAAAQLLMTRLEAIVAGGLHVAPQPLSLAGARGFQVDVPQLPQPIVALAQGDKLAAGYAASSAPDLLAPGQRLDASPAGKAAIATLGAGYTPSLVVIVPPLVSLLRSLDGLQVTHLQAVVPYLEPYRSLALGTKIDSGRVSVRIVAALR